MRQFLSQLLSPVYTKPRQHLDIGVKGLFGLSAVSMSLENFNTHLYVVGQSGQGKSKFLEMLLHQLVFTDWGVGVFDPHSDLASDLLAQLASYPTYRPWLSEPANQKRLIYLDPSCSDTIIPANILINSTCTPYETAENVVEAFRRVWPETLSTAPRFAQILRNAVLVLALSGLSLLELEPLLTDADLRKRLLSTISDPLVASFFEQQYDRWGREQPIFAASVLNKVSAFLFKPTIRCMLGAQENRLDFRQILDSGSVLIVNLGGFHDEETPRLLGSLLLTSLEQAAFSRSNQVPSARRPFFCMIDEFPLFCSRDQTSLARILSECRKFRLHLGLCHQTVTQIGGARIQGALENAKLKVIFGTGRQTAQTIVSDLFMPDPKAIKHEVDDQEAQARSHPVYQQLTEQWETWVQTIQRLQRRHMLAKLPDGEEVFSLRTPIVPEPRITPAQLEQWKTFLVRQVGKSRQALEAEIAQRRQRLHITTKSRGDSTTQKMSRSPVLTPEQFWI